MVGMLLGIFNIGMGRYVGVAVIFEIRSTLGPVRSVGREYVTSEQKNGIHPAVVMIHINQTP